ncbi:MAG: GIY-YIG nuclease family protein [Myxococcota bacterium]|jgi:putative endonuclease|nr:GIY-YIG nuclease family protein [Myxococcota bacterium]
MSEVVPAESAPPRSGWRVYLVRCADGSLYTGVTSDLARRLRQHDAGRGARYTRGRGPVVLVHQEAAASLPAALRRERQIKRLSRARKELLIGEGRG